jgi:hypothetical protein
VAEKRIDGEAYRRRTLALVDAEVAKLDGMRAAFAGSGEPSHAAMAKVCGWAKERVEFLAIRLRLLDHDPEVALTGPENGGEP